MNLKARFAVITNILKTSNVSADLGNEKPVLFAHDYGSEAVSRKPHSVAILHTVLVLNVSKVIALLGL